MENSVLKLQGITKTFGGVTALNNVQFELKKGEVHALMGENGAGKSTFIKIITGVLHPDGGTILYEGDRVQFKNSIQAGKAGIAAIYQHTTAFPKLTVTENIFMGREIRTKVGTYNWAKMHKKAKEYISLLTNDIDVKKPMNDLSVAQQQLVEIAKALSRDARVLILDEPTASLSKKECEELYSIVDKLTEKGVSMIFITHKFEDMYRVAQRVTVFRDSEYIGTWNVNDISNKDLIKEMVGRELTELYPKRQVNIGEEVLRVENLSGAGCFKNISFNVKKGEVIALTGLVGAGRTEVCEAIYGITKPENGKIYLDGKEVQIKNSDSALKHGIGLLPEDRLAEGLNVEMPIYTNVSASNIQKFINHFLINNKSELNTASELCEKTELKAESMYSKPIELSGGNQQKVVFAKLLNCDLKVLILDEPTKGIDVGTKSSIYRIINELAAKGYGIIMVSSEMPEVLGMADRIIVMSNGMITADFPNENVTSEQILEKALERLKNKGIKI